MLGSQINDARYAIVTQHALPHLYTVIGAPVECEVVIRAIYGIIDHFAPDKMQRGYRRTVADILQTQRTVYLMSIFQRSDLLIKFYVAFGELLILLSQVEIAIDGAFYIVDIAYGSIGIGEESPLLIGIEAHQQGKTYRF